MSNIDAGERIALEICRDCWLDFRALDGLTDLALARIGTGETSRRDARILLATRDKKFRESKRKSNDETKARSHNGTHTRSRR